MGDLRASKRFVICLALLAFCGGVSQNLHALSFHHKHRVPKSQKIHYKPDHNAYLFGGKYKSPKKQHFPKKSY